MSVNVNILLKGETHFMVHNSVKYIILSTFLTDLWDFVKLVTFFLALHVSLSSQATTEI